MNQVNLLPFADHSQKLPANFLAPVKAIPKRTSWKILSTHLIDFTLAFSTSAMMGLIFGQAVKSLLITNRLHLAFSKQSLMPLEVTLLPLILMSYFFIGNFLNHGQTLGMMIMKGRISMKQQDFKEALIWAGHSTLLCLSFGISYLFTRQAWTKFTGHDYLYHQLMEVKEVSPVDLFVKIEEFESAAQEEMEEIYLKAA